ncbi:MAG: tyrosine-protein phosphatase [Micrococcaceae bacterium]
MDLTHTLTTTYNSRSLGGMKTADGGTIADVLFRSDALDQLDSQGQENLKKLNIGTVIDMRTKEGSSQSKDHLPDHIEYVSLPMAGGAMDENVKEVLPKAGAPSNLTQEQLEKLLAKVPTLDEIYIGILTDDSKQFATFARTIIKAAGTDKPGVLFHCTAGKDRTGLTTALLLSLAGVPEKDIVADYTITQENTSGEFGKKLSSLITALGVPMTPRIETIVLKSPASTLENALAWVKTHHKDAAGYFKNAGLSEEEIVQLKAAIIKKS